MKPHSLLLAATLTITSSASLAQLPNIDVGAANGQSLVRINDPSAMGKKSPDVTYRDVDGRYFWKEDWNPALITVKVGDPIKMSSVKINLYTNDIHYLTKDGELAAQTNKLKRIILYSNKPTDSTTVVGIFDVLVNPNTTKEALFEVLNQGQTQLLRRVTVKLKKDAFDPATEKDKYHFDYDTDYFIRTGNNMKMLKSLSKSAIFEAIPSASSGEAWLAENKNKLKKPDDVAEFLTYLNSQSK